MRLRVYRHLWGVNRPWPEAFAASKAAGYDGVEAVAPPPDREGRFADLLAEHGFDWIAVVQTNGATAADHVADLRRQCETAKRLNARFVCAHAGRDAFRLMSLAELFNGALAVEADLGLPIAHETHRGRPLYNPWTTDAILDAYPTLKLTCDLSHWVCVCERLLGDCEPIVRRMAEQAFHVHARVGHAQGPQVADPRSPAYVAEVAAHERWWDAIWESQRRRGMAESTLCPEFGPVPYLPTDPADGRPLADLDAVIDWQAQRQRARFAALVPSPGNPGEG